MKTISEYLKDNVNPDCSWQEYQTFTRFKDDTSPEHRLARKLIARNLLKPFKEYERFTHILLNIDGKLYGLPQKWTKHLKENEKVDKRKEFLQRREKLSTKAAQNFFSLRYVTAVDLNINQTPVIFTNDPQYDRPRKYNKVTKLKVQTGFYKAAKYSTNDFLVHNIISQERIDDSIVCEVRGWWKSDIKGYDRTHYTKTAWLAYDVANSEHRTITMTKATALRGLSTRLTNKVMKTLVA